MIIWGPWGKYKVPPKVEAQIYDFRLSFPQVSVVGSLHRLLTVLSLCFVCDACGVCGIVGDVGTVAAQVVNEVWEPGAHSQLEKL